MLSEEEKYHLLNQYLKGKLDADSELQLKSAFDDDQHFAQEVAYHKLANMVVEENYLLDVRATTGNIIARNSGTNNGKWIAGILIVSAGLGTFFYLNAPKHSPEEVNSIKKEVITQSAGKIQQDIKKTPVTATPIQKYSTSIKPKLPPHQTTNNLSEDVSAGRTELTISAAEPVRQTEDFPAIKKSGILLKPTVEKPEIKTPVQAGFQQEENLPLKTESAELILNPDKNELVRFPVSADFDGELIIHNSSGQTIFRQQIHAGVPDTWNGQTQTGGIAQTGQYGFILKSADGRETTGYVMVVR